MIRFHHHILPPLLLLICSYGELNAQSIDFSGDTVQIEGRRLASLSPGHKRIQIDSLTQKRFIGQNLSDILQIQSGLFIKSYGPANLASISSRGTAATHTAILWNGFNLQNPMNGQGDLSLFPVFFFDEMAIQYGTATALFGSGAIGASLELNNQSQFQKGLQSRLFLQAGSFGYKQIGLDLRASSEKFYFRSRFFGRQANNNFYIPEKDQAQSHAFYRQGGYLQELSMRPTARQEVNLWLWTQYSHRELPPPISSNLSQAEQEDRNMRMGLKWTFLGDKKRLIVRTGWFKDGLFYADSLAEIFSDNQSLRMVNEVESFVYLSPRQRIHVGIHHSLQSARASAYGDSLPGIHQLALFSSYHYRSLNQKWEGVLSVRKGFRSDLSIPFTPSFSLRWNVLEHLSIKSQLGRNFRLPTFNDLYWQPGGNPLLKPEQGWQQELGLQYQRSIKKLSTDIGLNVFSLQVDNWILWRPGNSYWSPENLRKVWSRGIEAHVNLSHSGTILKKRLMLNYSYTQAEVVEVFSARDDALGKQLIYTPMHQAAGWVSAQYKNILLSYRHQMISKRFTSSDNSYFLPFYQLAQLDIGYNLYIKEFHVEAGMRCDNLWNQSYQVVENRAMPLRSFLFYLNLQFLAKATSTI